MDTSEKLQTPLVRVHFEGTLLPDRVEIFGLLIKVLYPNKYIPMFCEKCQNYGHASKFSKKLENLRKKSSAKVLNNKKNTFAEVLRISDKTIPFSISTPQPIVFAYKQTILMWIQFPLHHTPLFTVFKNRSWLVLPKNYN